MRLFVVHLFKIIICLYCKAPGLTTTIDGKNKTLYMQTVASIEEKTRANLKLSLADLGLQDGSELVVADSTTPASIRFVLKLSD